MYAITGATGHIGKRIVEQLMRAGKEVRALARQKARLSLLEQRGAQTWTGDLRDRDFLARAFTGAEAVYTMIPPAADSSNLREYQREVGEATAAALQCCGVRFVVNLSSLGAERSEGTGPVLGLHDQEERLNRIEALNVLHLRPAFFMENVLALVPLVRTRGLLGMALRADVRFPMIAARDIASVAAQRLLRLNFTGKSVQLLLGQRDVTMSEVARALGRAIGQPDLPYVQLGDEAALHGMRSSGVSDDVGRRYIELIHAINEGQAAAGIRRTSAETTPTSIEEFAMEFAEAYRTAYVAAA